MLLILRIITIGILAIDRYVLYKAGDTATKQEINYALHETTRIRLNQSDRQESGLC